jgi:ribosome-binding factor A
VSQRTDRLNSQIREELMQMIQREMGDPRLGFVTVTAVETATDLSQARVWVSVLGESAAQEDSLKALRSAAPWMRRRLGERLHIRTIPVLDIRADASIAGGDRVLRILNDLDNEAEA